MPSPSGWPAQRRQRSLKAFAFGAARQNMPERLLKDKTRAAPRFDEGRFQANLFSIMYAP
jgi:hypothetical protein